jgi:ATP-dependent Clp protease ATP-binding subunit ClpC
MERFDRFAESAQDAARRAYEILARYGHTMVDTEHLLLALIEQPEGVVSEILERMGVDSEAIRQRLDDDLQRTFRSSIYGSSGVSQVYITPKLKRLLDQSNEEAARLKDEYIGAEHLFLAIPSERNTAASRVLAEAGVSRKGILEVLPDVRSHREVRSQRAPHADPQYRLAGGVRVRTEAGTQPQLILTQGGNLIRVPPRDVLPLIAALAQAAAALTSAQREQQPL